MQGQDLSQCWVITRRSGDAALKPAIGFFILATSGGETMRKVALAMACPHAHVHSGTSVTRRGFLGHAIHLSMATAAASVLLGPQALRSLAMAGRAIKFSHGTGLCNMPLFYAAEKNLFGKYGIDDDVVMTPMAAPVRSSWRPGRLRGCHSLYQRDCRLYALTVVFDGGRQRDPSLIIVAKPEIKTFQDLIVMVGRQMMNMNLTFLGMAMIGLVGYLLDAGLAVLQTRVLWWKSSAQL